MLDKLFINCEYPDFAEKRMSKGSVGIENNKIGYISDDENSEKPPRAKDVIDVKGKVLSPGFIDIHMHEENFAKEGYKYIVSKMLLSQGVTTCVGGNCGITRQPVEMFRKGINALGGSPVNYMMLAGYNTIRTNCGVELYGKPTKKQQLEIDNAILNEIDQGAAGISFGLEYGPGIMLDEMANAVKLFDDKGALVSAHYRADATEAIESIKEMIAFQNMIENPFQISHLSSCSAMGQMEEALEIINDSMQKDSRLNYDTYPYNAFSTKIGTEVFSEGCFERWNKSYDSILLTDEPYKGEFCNKDLFNKVRKEYPDMYVVAFVMREDEIEAAIKNKNGMVASDAIVFHSHGHPRAAGTFARLLGRYVRNKKSLTLYEALEKITIRPADRMRLFSKGRIQKGCDADLVIFDKDLIIDKATFTEMSVPEGIIAVYVNGAQAVAGQNILREDLGCFIPPCN